MKTKHTIILAVAVFLGLSAAVGAQTAVGYYTRYREQAAASVPTPPSSAWQNCYLDSTSHTMKCKNSAGASTAVGGAGTIGGSIASTQVAVGSGADTVAGSGKLLLTDPGGADVVMTLGTGPQLTLRTASGSGYSSIESGSTQLRLIAGSTLILGSGIASIWPLGATTVGKDAAGMTGVYLEPAAAPGNPATAGEWVIYVDSGDGNKLKAKASTGTVALLGTP